MYLFFKQISVTNTTWNRGLVNSVVNFLYPTMILYERSLCLLKTSLKVMKESLALSATKYKNLVNTLNMHMILISHTRLILAETVPIQPFHR